MISMFHVVQKSVSQRVKIFLKKLAQVLERFVIQIIIKSILKCFRKVQIKDFNLNFITVRFITDDFFRRNIFKLLPKF